MNSIVTIVKQWQKASYEKCVHLQTFLLTVSALPIPKFFWSTHKLCKNWKRCDKHRAHIFCAICASVWRITEPESEKPFLFLDSQLFMSTTNERTKKKKTHFVLRNRSTHTTQPSVTLCWIHSLHVYVLLNRTQTRHWMYLHLVYACRNRKLFVYSVGIQIFETRKCSLC